VTRDSYVNLGFLEEEHFYVDPHVFADLHNKTGAFGQLPDYIDALAVAYIVRCGSEVSDSAPEGSVLKKPFPLHALCQGAAEG